MIISILLAISGIAASILLFNIWKYRDLMKLPGPSYFMIFATTFGPKLTPQDMFKNFMSLNKLYGPVVKLWINPLRPVLIVTDLKYVEFLLSSNVHVDKSSFYEFFHRYVGFSIALVEGSEWKRQMKLVNPAFHPKVIETYTNTIESYSNKMITTLEERVHESVIDVFPIICLTSLRITCASLFKLMEDFDETTNLEFMKAVDGFLSFVSERTLSMWKQKESTFQFCSSYKNYLHYVKVLNDFTEKVIDATIRQDSDWTNRKHVVDYLVEGYGLDDIRLRNNMSTFIVAGHETTATAMSFALYELAKHKDVQVKILEESDLVLGKDRDAEITYQHVRELKYLEAVIKECLRLYPVVPFYDRKTKEEILIDGVRIPKGTDISICAYNVHRNEENYHDPEKFLPDRFLPENEKNIKPYSYIPFSYGPRNCIGRQFAMTEMKLILAKILRHFELHVADTPQKMDLKVEFLLRSTTGMPVKLTRRL